MFFGGHYHCGNGDHDDDDAIGSFYSNLRGEIVAGIANSIQENSERETIHLLYGIFDWICGGDIVFVI